MDGRTDGRTDVRADGRIFVRMDICWVLQFKLSAQNTQQEALIPNKSFKFIGYFFEH